ncbi:MAG: hypothetical protein KC609_22495 [Myxococcales bacterium]|nr:hypothetical protein [Myxococcales bacterium]
MRKLVIMTVAMALFGFGMVGCKKSDKARCEKAYNLMKDEPMMKKFIEKSGGLDSMVKACVEKSEKQKKDKPKYYECNGKCVDDAKNANDIMSCSKKCRDAK